MKKLSILKLNALSDSNLLDREMNTLKGGEHETWSCACGCNGTASTADNGQSNVSYQYTQSYGGNYVCMKWTDWNDDGDFTDEGELVKNTTF